MAGQTPYDMSSESDFRQGVFTGMGMNLDDAPKHPQSIHPGDVHDPIEFGYDLSKPEDREAWTKATGEVTIVSDFTVIEAELVQSLVAKGHARDVAVQAVLYDRLG